MRFENNPCEQGYTFGHLLLPPKGIKDAEFVSNYSAIFTVVKGQANSIEVAYANPEQEGSCIYRFLLAPGDIFIVPYGNAYRLVNHSNSTECLISFNLLK